MIMATHNPPTFSAQIDDLDYEIDQLGIASEFAFQKLRYHQNERRVAERWAKAHQGALHLLMEAKRKKLEFSERLHKQEMALLDAQKMTKHEMQSAVGDVLTAVRGVVGDEMFERVRAAMKELNARRAD